MKYLKAAVLFSALIAANIFADIIYPDFMVSMTRKGEDLSKIEQFFKDSQRNDDCYKIQNLEIFRAAYSRNVILFGQDTSEVRIPKIIHQIWLGSPVPVKYLHWMRTWTEWHGWEYKLWTEDDVKSLFLYNQDLYDGSTNYGEKSDLLRLEVLLHFGGIYVDIDFECVNRAIFDDLNCSFDFYVGFEPIEHGTMNGTYKICNAIIASCPHHPIIKNLIIGMRSNWQNCHGQSAVQKSGPDYFSRMILDYEKGHLSSPEMKANNSEYRNMYLPCTFFYPFSEPNVRAAKSSNELVEKKSPETAAIHYWNGSWFIPGGRGA